MSRPVSISTDGQRALLEQLQELVAERTRREGEIEEQYRSQQSAAEKEHRQRRAQLSQGREQDEETARAEFREAKQAIEARFAQEQESAQAEYDRRRRQIQQHSGQDVHAAKVEWTETRQRAITEFKETRQQALAAFGEHKSRLDEQWQQLQQLEASAHWILQQRGCQLPPLEAAAEPTAEPGAEPAAEPQNEQSGEQLAALGTEHAEIEGESESALSEAVASAEELLEEDPDAAEQRYQRASQAAGERFKGLRRQFLPNLIQGDRPFALFFLFLLGSIYPYITLLGWQNWYWIAASLATAVGATLAIVFLVGPVAKRQTRREFEEVILAKREAEAALQAELASYRRRAEAHLAESAAQRDSIVGAADEKWAAISGSAEGEQKEQLARVTKKYQPLLENLGQAREQELARNKAEYESRLASLVEQYEQQTAAADAEFDQRQSTTRNDYETSWQQLAERWHQGVEQFAAAVEQMETFCRETFPAWEQVNWDDWQPPAATVPALPLGTYRFDLGEVPHGVPGDERLQLERTAFDLPVALSFPECPSLLLETSGAGRDAAVGVLQNAMLRLLTAMPPGKVRFTIIDPTGLGQNFSAFMHLTDYDERLVSMRIWTETTHINQRLTDLTEHMEKVIQKYLRNEFASIEEYNQHAGEVAEPFQILVVANFPANFSEEGARRLVSIATSGARCGVYTLMSVDTKMKMPRNFDLSDVEKHATTLQWDQDRFRWKDKQLKSLPIALTTPPEHDLFTTAIKTVGRHAVDSNRVEVPFRTVVPPEEEWWSQDSRGEIIAPLGRAGATKLQYMRLGKGTSQHVLVAGKTGSGKSTLWHALITSLALHYSPHEVHFYLVDFKKGVEFKAYARHRVPHARVIAIESEREFGLSVLERLDLELRQRGDLFRDRGVQGLQGYRNAHPAAVLPRILLIIDEFQELFVKDDKISQEASLLLDRLVRQGRAFGIHVLLGSQTLAGAYSLARSTIGQMAVRIALQCSEGDAHLILSEDNTAARLLSRPGEAIYNDANGLFEGNHPFQVVWLPDAERDEYLKQVGHRAEQAAIQLPPAVVFEGNIPADPSDNELLREAISAPGSQQPAVSPQAWLGAAVAIKDPTSATFGPHGGSNLLIVGQEEEMAVGILANCLVSLAAQQRPAAEGGQSPRFYVFDAPRPEDLTAGLWQRIKETLPIDLRIVSPRKATSVISQLAGEVQARSEQEDESQPPVYLLFNNLARFRELRKSQDDLMFSLDDEKPESAGGKFKDILRDGPVLGVHSIIWCDSYNNVTRWLDREMLREIEMKVAFQISMTDSSNLIDSPAASRLGQHRAIYYHEEQGELEKFRPYGLPADEWLSWVAEQLAGRTMDPSSA